ncbi:MAG: hypothetical protein ACPHK2_06165 [Candidatus Poseidoniaceae archaeon]
MSAGVYIVSIKNKNTNEVVKSWDFYSESEAMKKYWGIKQSNEEIVSVDKITFGKEEDASRD